MQNTQSEEAEQAWESESDTAEMVEWLYQDFFKIKINRVRDLMEKVNNVQEQVDSVNKEMEILRIRSARNKKKTVT